MSTADWQQQTGGGFPQGGGSARAGWPSWLKLVIFLIILIALGWVILLIAQYCRTGDKISDLPGVPPPVAGLFGDASFEYVRSIDGLANPMGVAVAADGRVYVTEGAGERLIRVYDSTGKAAGSFAPPDTETGGRAPVYVAVNPSGDVYVSDRDTASIFIFSADGESKGTLAAPEGYEDWHPLALAFDKSGNLYVSDVTPDKHRILIFDRQGALKLSFGSQGEDEGQFWFPNGIAIDSKGRIFVADSNNGRMQVFDNDGKFLFKVGRGMGRGDLSIPRGIVIDSKDRLLIVDTYRGAVQAYEVSADPGSGEAPVKFAGSFAESIGDGVFFLYPNGLALDGKGQIYIADKANDRVQIWKY